MKHIFLALALVVPAFADDKKPAPKSKADKPRFELKLGGSLKRITPVQTITLKFTIRGEDENESFFVLCGGGKYTISQDHAGTDFEDSLHLDGSAEIAGKGKIALAYSAVQTHENRAEGDRASFMLKGSAILKAGKETVLGHLGGQSLVIIATLNDE